MTRKEAKAFVQFTEDCPICPYEIDAVDTDDCSPCNALSCWMEACAQSDKICDFVNQKTQTILLEAQLDAETGAPEPSR